MAIHAQFYRPAIWTRKVGQGNLVFGVRSKFGDHRSVACRDNADIRIIYDVLQVGQSDLVFAVHQYVPVCKISGLCVQRL